jgi:hypothetical protein
MHIPQRGESEPDNNKYAPMVQFYTVSERSKHMMMIQRISVVEYQRKNEGKKSNWQI